MVCPIDEKTCKGDIVPSNGIQSETTIDIIIFLKALYNIIKVIDLSLLSLFNQISHVYQLTKLTSLLPKLKQKSS